MAVEQDDGTLGSALISRSMLVQNHQIPTVISDDIDTIQGGEPSEEKGFDIRHNDKLNTPTHLDDSWGEDSDSICDKPKMNLTKLLPPSSSDDEADQEAPVSLAGSQSSGPPKPPRLNASSSSLVSLEDNDNVQNQNSDTKDKSVNPKKDFTTFPNPQSSDGINNTNTSGDNFIGDEKAIEKLKDVERKESSSGSWNNQSDSVSLKHFSEKKKLTIDEIKDESFLSSVSSAYHKQDISACEKSVDVVGKGSFDQELESLEYHQSQEEEFVVDLSVRDLMNPTSCVEEKIEQNSMHNQGMDMFFTDDNLNNQQYIESSPETSLVERCNKIHQSPKNTETENFNEPDNRKEFDEIDNDVLINSIDKPLNQLLEASNESDSSIIEFSDTESKGDCSVNSDQVESDICNDLIANDIPFRNENILNNNDVGFYNGHDLSDIANRGTLGRRDTLHGVEEVWETNASIDKDDYETESGLLQNDENEADLSITEGDNQKVRIFENVENSESVKKTMKLNDRDDIRFATDAEVFSLGINKSSLVRTCSASGTPVPLADVSRVGVENSSLIRTSSASGTPVPLTSPRSLMITPIALVEKLRALNVDKLDDEINKGTVSFEGSDKMMQNESDSTIVEISTKETVGRKTVIKIQNVGNNDQSSKLSRNRSISMGELFTENLIKRRPSFIMQDKNNINLKKNCLEELQENINTGEKMKKFSHVESPSAAIDKSEDMIDNGSLGDGLSTSTDTDDSSYFVIEGINDLTIPLAQFEDMDSLPEKLRLLIRKVRLLWEKELSRREEVILHNNMLRKSNRKLTNQIEELETINLSLIEKNIKAVAAVDLIKHQEHIRTEDIDKYQSTVKKMEKICSELRNKYHCLSVKDMHQSVKLEDLSNQVEIITNINSTLKEITLTNDL